MKILFKLQLYHYMNHHNNKYNIKIMDILINKMKKKKKVKIMMNKMMLFLVECQNYKNYINYLKK